MTKLLAGLFLLVPLYQAKAEEFIVYHEKALSYERNTFLGGNYEINKELGRAWVNLEFSSSFQEGTGDQVRVKIPGMKYDLTTKEIVIESEAGRVVCAFEKKNRLGFKSLRKTNDCGFKESFSTVISDDGFNTHKVKMRTITFFY